MPASGCICILVIDVSCTVLSFKVLQAQTVIFLFCSFSVTSVYQQVSNYSLTPLKMRAFLEMLCKGPQLPDIFCKDFLYEAAVT